MRLVGILGGTFNPIHYGHLRMAQELADALHFDEVKFIPSANPPHKDEVNVSAEHRAAMVGIAIKGNPLFSLDSCELNREGASYTIDTLISLRETLGGETALCLMMGSDAFVKLNTWHRWQRLLDYAHIVLVQRPDSKPQEKLPAELETLLHDHYTEQHADLSKENAGFITMQNISAHEISATQIRNLLAHGQSARYLLPEAVADYIQQHHLYQL
jgi:nicotinate-nucleotide adenylyltransferase